MRLIRTFPNGSSFYVSVTDRHSMTRQEFWTVDYRPNTFEGFLDMLINSGQYGVTIYVHDAEL